MPCAPFILSREAERAAIDGVIRDPAKRRLLYEMVEAVLRVRESGAVTPVELAPIVAGFEATDEAVWSRAAGWLAKLHAFDPNVFTSLEELARHPRAVVRFNLCASLGRFPADVAVPLLRRFLSDKSARVRGTVLNVVVVAEFRQLIPDFEALLAQEHGPEVQQDIRQAIALLTGQSFTRNGWVVRKLANGAIEYVQSDETP
jgi:HEAT repeat protein